MVYGINLTYAVNTPPITPELLQGMRITESQSQFKFSNLECMAGDDVVAIKDGTTQEGVEAGVFVTGVENTFGDITIKKITAASQKIFGFTFLNFQRALVWSDTLECFVYQKGDEVTLMTEGDNVGHAEVAVNILDPVYTRIAADGAFTRLGTLSNVAGTGLLQIPGAKFIQKITAPGKVGLSLQDLY